MSHQHAGDGPRVVRSSRASRIAHAARLGSPDLSCMRAFYRSSPVCLSSHALGDAERRVESMASRCPSSRRRGGLEHVSRDGDDALLAARVAGGACRCVARRDPLTGPARPAGPGCPHPGRAGMLVRAAHAARVRRLRSAFLSGLERGRRRDATSRPQTHARVVAAAGG